MSIPMGLVSCSSPIILSGEGLSPEERSQIRAGHGIEFLQIDGKTVEGRWLVMKPGIYAVAFESKRDAKTVNGALEGVVDELECKIKVEVQAGEEVYISSRLKVGPSRFSGGYSKSNFHTEISLESSAEGQSKMADTSQCVGRINCERVDRARVMPTNCS